MRISRPPPPRSASAPCGAGCRSTSCPTSVRLRWRPARCRARIRRRCCRRRRARRSPWRGRCVASLPRPPSRSSRRRPTRRSRPRRPRPGGARGATGRVASAALALDFGTEAGLYQQRLGAGRVCGPGSMAEGAPGERVHRGRPAQPGEGLPAPAGRRARRSLSARRRIAVWAGWQAPFWAAQGRGRHSDIRWSEGRDAGHRAENLQPSSGSPPRRVPAGQSWETPEFTDARWVGARPSRLSPSTAP